MVKRTKTLSLVVKEANAPKVDPAANPADAKVMVDSTKTLAQVVLKK